MANILIAEDNRTDRLLLSTILKEAGHELFFASSGEQAMKVYLRNQIDVVVTDIQMPHGDGLELITALKGLDREASIIAVSGLGPGKLQSAQEEGARSILAKPIDRDTLLEALDEALGPLPTAEA